MASPILSSVCALCQFATLAQSTRPEVNAPPVIDAFTGPSAAVARDVEVTYQVAATDRDNDPLMYEWTLSNGDFFVTSVPSLAYRWPAGGNYTVTVVVDDLEPFHKVSSDPLTTAVSDPLTSFTDKTLQDNEDFEVPFHYHEYVLDRFFLGAKEGETEGQLYSSWDGLTWNGPVLVSEQLEVKKLLWDGSRYLLVAMEWDAELEAMVGVLYTSSGGSLWVKAWRSVTGDTFHSAAWDGSRLIIGMQDGKLLVSDDLANFSRVVLPETPTKGTPGDCLEMVELEDHVCVLTGNALYSLSEGMLVRDVIGDKIQYRLVEGSSSLLAEFAESRDQMIVVGDETVVLAGSGPQVWSTSDGNTWSEDPFYDGGEIVAGAGQVAGLVNIEGVLWARYRLTGDDTLDEWYVNHGATGRWIRVHVDGMPNGGLYAYGAGRLVSAQGVAGLVSVSDSLYPDNTAPTGELVGPSEVAARYREPFRVVLEDAQEDELSHWWDLGPGLPWVRGKSADLAWSTGGARTLTHWVTDKRGGLLMLEHTVGVEDPLDSWTEAETPSQEHLASIALGSNGRLVAVGSRSVVMRSDDAESWTVGTVDVSGVLLHSVVYTGTHFLAVGAKDRFGYIFRSAEGESWNNVWLGEQEATELRDVTMVGDATLAVGNSGLILRSTDHGATWMTVAQDVTTDLLRRISYGGGRVVIAHWESTLVSTDGLTWADGGAPDQGWNHLQWVKDRFINTGWRLSEGFWTSADGLSWDRPTVVPQKSYEMPVLVGVGDLYYAMGDYSQGPNQVAISVDGVRWFAREAPLGWSRRTAGLIYEDTIVTVGNNGQIWRSSGLSPQESKVVTFQSWQESYPLEGLNGPGDDPDADGFTNLVEFALWMKPNESEWVAEDGVTPNQGLRVFYNEATGKIDLEHLKPQVVERIVYQLRYTFDFETWYTADLVPEEIVQGNGSSRVCYRDLEQLPGVTGTRCFFEVAVTDQGDFLGF